MPSVDVNGLTIAYEDIGPTDAPVILLISGLGGQLIYWPDSLCHGLVEDGFRVIRFDHRDVGHSTKFEHAGMPDLATAMANAVLGRPVAAAYTLHDLAADAVGLLNALSIERAHLVGLSMGGMIAQIIAAHYGDRTSSLTSIMSTTGRRGLPSPEADAFNALLMPRPDGSDREAAVEHLLYVARHFVSPGFRPSDAELREKQERIFDRCYYPVGLSRHFMAILASGSRERLLRKVCAPTLVVHGSHDPLMTVEHGRDTADAVPNGELLVIDGLGHELPLAVVPVLRQAIASHCSEDETV